MQKEDRYAIIRNSLKKAKEDSLPIERDKFVAYLCIKWTSARRTINEYIKNLIILGYVREFEVDKIKYICWCLKDDKQELQERIREREAASQQE